MPVVTATIDQLSAVISNSAFKLIAIDGFQNSGKTTLAKILSQHCKLPRISADDHLNRNQGHFFDSLRLPEIAGSIRNSPQCIFEGICSLQILEAVHVKPDITIYVKRMARWGWADGEHLENLDIKTESLPKAGLIPLEPLQVALQGLWNEVVTYHQRFQPHLVATYVFERPPT
ncbi:MAG: hypothetical protein H7224_08365 [Polaromonas sp.]|nr:hypothetical protein [Polaromonas sp.]